LLKIANQSTRTTLQPSINQDLVVAGDWLIMHLYILPAGVLIGSCILIPKRLIGSFWSGEEVLAVVEGGSLGAHHGQGDWLGFFGWI